VYGEIRFHQLPRIRRIVVLVMLCLAVYLLANIGNVFKSGAKRNIYKISYPARLFSVLMTLILIFVSKFKTFMRFWQELFSFAILVPIFVMMASNGWKYYSFSEWYLEDLDVILRNASVYDQAVPFEIRDNLKMLKDDDCETVRSAIRSAMSYWIQKGISQANRTWPPIVMIVMLVVRIDVRHSTWVALSGFIAWYVVTGLSCENGWSDLKDTFLLALVQLSLTYACYLSDRTQRINFKYEQVLQIENDKLKHTIKKIEKFQEATAGEVNVVKKHLVNQAHNFEHQIVFDDLELIAVIGQGASGEVIKARYLGTDVVVKRMMRNNITEENMRAFAIEIHLMQGLRHPNIVQFIGSSFNTYANVCMVLEWVQRGDLYTVLRDKRLSLTWLDPLLKMACDSAAGMAYLHGCNPPVIHRDLKSLNILVSSTFGCKITDFGMSRQAVREKGLEDAMTLVGTPLWVPPEVIKSEKYSEKIDVYSFGVCLTEIQTREMPYADIANRAGMTKWKLLNMIAYEGARPTIPADTAPSLRKLMHRCLENNASKRPSMEECLHILQGEVRKELEQEEKQKIKDRLHMVHNTNKGASSRVLGQETTHPPSGLGRLRRDSKHRTKRGDTMSRNAHNTGSSTASSQSSHQELALSSSAHARGQV